MTGVRDTTDRATKWMRYIARGLTVILAAGWTLLAAIVAIMLGSGGLEPYFGGGWGDGICLGLLATVPAWVTVVIAWRREFIGGVVLTLVGAALTVAVVVSIIRYPPDALAAAFGPLLVGLPPLVAGFLFFASWWRSRRAGIPQNR